jgi:hypothetical protein
VVLVEKAELWKAYEVFYEFPASLNELSAQHPANVSPPQSIDARWMDIFFRV